MARTKTTVPKLRLARPGFTRRKFVALLVVVALVWLVVQNPTGAAHVVGTVVHGVATFVRSLR